MINVQNVSKEISGRHILNNISFQIRQGEIVGFLGPNGAGKTTLMRLLTGFYPATKGTIDIGDIDIAKEPFLAKEKIGYLPETPPLYPELTVTGYLKFAADLKKIPVKSIHTRVQEVLEECNLKDVANQLIATLSKGYQQRVGIAQAIINNPQVLILDEPTNGLDPLQIQQVRKLIKNLETNRTVILSTHILSEIEQIAQRVIILKKGSVVKDELLKTLLEKEKTKTLEDIFLQLTSG